MKTKIISGFPAVGKSHYQENKTNVLDSDSSKFSWISEGVRHPEFPQNYMNHIKDNLDHADTILVSSHKVVRSALVDNDLDFTLVYPKRELKQEYLDRCKSRGSDNAFLEMLSSNWDNFLDELDSQQNCKKILLESGQYLSDVI